MPDLPAHPHNIDRLGVSYQSYPDLTYSIQNCNSLNISTVCQKQISKIIAITALCTDIIFLSDIRLNANSKQVEKIKKMFIYNPTHSYDAYFHSSKNRRGVGILISKKLSYTVEKFYRDTDENILGLILKIDDFSLRAFSIYGPNHDDKNFFKEIDSFLSQDREIATVLGGDWNSTYSTAAAEDNIDIRNMRNPPSTNRSAWLREVCARRGLSDPFRALHPNLRDYTFVPSGGRNNRSRLDFFLIYDELIPRIRSCSIKETQQIKLLDHKPVLLDFTRNKYKSRPFINHTILSNPRTDDVVLAAVYDTYLHYMDPLDEQSRAALTPPGVHYVEGHDAIINHTILSNPRTDDVVLAAVYDTYLHHMDPLDEQSRAALTPPGVHYVEGHDAIQHEKEKVGNLLRLTREYNDIFEQLTLDPQNNHLSLQLAGKNTEITLQKNTLTSFENLLNIKLSTSDDTFLEILMGNVKGAIIGYQQWVKRIENSLKTRLVNRLNELKLNRDANFDEIANTERELLENNRQRNIRESQEPKNF